jgi:hypothetical protein
LEAGHIVPAFVYRWLKETSATGFLRGGENPNVRIQDGWRRRWFCRTCEDRMGRFERAFSKDLFPLVVGQRPVPYRYGPWLSRFLASVAWRTVMLYAEDGDDPFPYFTPEQKTLIPQALEHWRAFVHGEADTPSIHELHFVAMGTWSGYTADRPLPPNINVYTLRSVDIDVAAGQTQAFAFVKIGAAVVYAFIQPPPADMWIGTKVALGEGQIDGQTTVPIQILDHFISRARMARNAAKTRSARQNDKIRESMAANMDRASESETFRAIGEDVRRFGVDRVFSSDDESPETQDRQ